ncbi:hypothetical protein MSAN_02108700 [Mycena sanguinolenta]|uniref:Uncharacterized protein n=1 Tax=Mycena sanguinolenta TaxID=230812 RepID=A0A8H7CLT7_9AGAR|nr:hypothetical protein MSAN_02108700 [Mycena sanguinolenta]
MPPRRRQALASSPPPQSSPTRTTDNILELALQVTPSKSPATLDKVRRQIQSHANNLRGDVSTLKRRVDDLENQSIATETRTKRRKRFNRAADADETISNPKSLEGLAREKGRRFLITEALFLVDDDVFVADEEEDFDVRDEFTSKKNKIQGQLRRILQLLPEKLKVIRTTDLIAGAFYDGMSSSRSTISNRLRGASLACIVDDPQLFATSSGRYDAFAKDIGYQPGTPTSEPYYSKLNVPVLYSDWEGTKNVNGLFRGPCLLKIYASLIRGPNGAVGLLEGKSKRPAAKTVERMYSLEFSTLGAIVNSAVLCIWLHSPDTNLTEIGDQTGINYRDRQTYYMQHLVEAMDSKKDWALELVEYWDRILFPDADQHRSTDALQPGDCEEDDDDFFSSAPSKEPSASHSHGQSTPPRQSSRSAVTTLSPIDSPSYQEDHPRELIILVLGAVLPLHSVHRAAPSPHRCLASRLTVGRRSRVAKLGLSSLQAQFVVEKCFDYIVHEM